MSIFDGLKKLIGLGESEDSKQEAAPIKEDTEKKTSQQLFEEWYKKLPPEKKKNVDKKIEKLTHKYGNPICCLKCGSPGKNKEKGPFRKVSNIPAPEGKKLSGYMHEYCMRG